MALEHIEERSATQKRLLSKIRELQLQLREAEKVLQAIKSGDSDALVISGPEGERVYTLTGADRPYRSLVEEMNEGAMTLGPDGTVLYCNQRFAEMLQMPLDKVLGEPFARFVAPEDLTRLEPLLAQALRGNAKDELTLLAADASQIFIQLSLRTLMVEGTLNLSAVAMDMTARKQVEDALRESEEHFRLLLSGVKDYAIFMLDPAGQVISWNENAEQVEGYRADEILGNHFSKLYPPEEVARGKPERHLRTAIAQGRTEDEDWQVRRDGTRFWANVIISPLYDDANNLRGFVQVTRDITRQKQAQDQVQKYADELERRVAERTSELETANQKLQTEIGEHAEAEEALRASEERFRVALADSRITVYNQDRDLRYTWIHNPAPGLQVQDLLGKTDAEVFSAGEAARLKEIKLQALEKGTQAYGEIALTSGDETRHFDLTVEPQLDPSGNIVGITCIAVDITERKIAESALQQANQNLLNWAGELEQRNREISQMNEMGDLLQSCLTIEEAYRVIEQSGRILFPGDSGALYVLNESKNLAEMAASWGDPLSELTEHVFAPDKCWALRRGRIHIVANSSFGLLCSHVDRAAAARTPYSYLCAPMVAQGEALGVLYLQSGVRQPDLSGRREGTLTESKERLAVSVAEHVALALSSLKLRETLHNQAIRDPLTGLFNRRYMEESLERELRRSIRRKSTVGIIMLDLDHFKRFNDTFGHEVGDAILSAFGDFLQRHVRGEDLACRYGGEEFTLILPEANLQETHDRAEQVRRQIKFVAVQHNGRSFANLSISCGVAVFPEHGSSAETILRAADAALYRAKADGRDRVVVTG